MNSTQALFLEALRACLDHTTVQWNDPLPTEEWRQIFRMADIHFVVPMIYEAVYASPAFKSMDPALAMQYKQQVIRMVTMQTMKTQQFLVLNQKLRKAGVTPCVFKGILCRQLYPNPDARLSSDEDILVPPEQFEACDAVMKSFGMVYSDPEMDLEKSYEVPYGMPGSPLYIEVHKYLFPPDSQAYGDLNQFFADIHDRLMEVEIEGTKVLSMNPTDHMFYLICHSFKHFLHSGFGIRQVCDINRYANVYGSQIDWNRVLESCREIRADLFAASMFRIGEKHLGFDPEKACYPDSWKSIPVDETAMLADLLDSGVYGQSDLSRKHSSNITLNALIADKRGQKAKGGVMRSLFLPYGSMVGTYRYLERFPFLLPVAWVQRVIRYGKQSAGSGKSNSAAESIRIGNQRVELLKEYGIIKNERTQS